MGRSRKLDLLIGAGSSCAFAGIILITATALGNSAPVALSGVALLTFGLLFLIEFVRRSRSFPISTTQLYERLSDQISSERAKESRHEYHMERALQRIEERVARVDVRGIETNLQRIEERVVRIEVRGMAGLWHPTSSSVNGVLFVTSNGAGLGHLTRLLAVARELPDSVMSRFLTLSRGYRQVAHLGFPIHYFPSAEASSASVEEWNRTFSRFFLDLVRRERPVVVVFDGTWVYKGVTEVCRTEGIRLVWIQRGLWKDEVDASSVQRHDARSVSDFVIIPGDYAGPEEVDLGRGIVPIHVPPIVYQRESEVLTRSAALAELGLDPARRYVLINLGGGVLNDSTDSLEIAARTVASLGSDWAPVVLVSPLSERSVTGDGIMRVRAYPAMKYVRAFEFAVAAAGYNSVQEAISLRLPIILVPNPRTLTDDQIKRARLVAEKGLALCAETSVALELAIVQLGDDGFRRAMASTQADAPVALGAKVAASEIEVVLARTRWAIDQIDTIDDASV